MNVSAVLVTRGNVDMEPVVASLPIEWEIVEWNNAHRAVYIYASGERGHCAMRRGNDLSVYGRYAAIEHASHDLIYVQDDDVIVSEPQDIVDVWLAAIDVGMTAPFLVANMPQEFNHDGYTDSALVGFGAAFHRGAPSRAFRRWYEWAGMTSEIIDGEAFFHRTCDVVFTTLTERILVDVPKVNREFAEDADRMYRQPDHVGERARVLTLARQARDAR